MKRTLTYNTLLIAILCLHTACTGDYEITNNEEDKVIMSFNTNIGDMPESLVVTRGYSANETVSEYTFQVADKFSIGIRGESANGRGTSEVIKQYSISTISSPQTLIYENDADGSITNEFYWLSKTEAIQIRAWSYGNSETPASAPDGQAFSVESTQTATPVKELLYSPNAEYRYSNNNGIVNMTFYHQLSRIVVVIPATLDTGVSLENVSVYGSISGTFTEPISGNYGEWSNQSGLSEIFARNIGTNTYDAIIIPGSASIYATGEKLIEIATSNGNYSYRIPTGGLLFLPGYQYTFTITELNKVFLDVYITISSWGNTDTVTSGTIDRSI